MKLFFDQNLSPRLVKRLDDLYPDSSHVFLIGLDTASDSVIWEYARANEFMVVTKMPTSAILTLCGALLRR